MSKVVEVRQLTKSYGSVLAVNQVSFSIETEKIYGLLGRNGAGKTTIMQIITAQLFATSGGLELVPVSLQQLIVHLTSEPSERKAVEVR
jgi:ABC-2 type transport system ATP-binding protein